MSVIFRTLLSADTKYHCRIKLWSADSKTPWQLVDHPRGYKLIGAKVISICSLIDSHVLAFLWTIGHLCHARVKHLQQSKWYCNIRANIIVANKVKVTLRKIRIGERRSIFELCISFWLTFSREKSKSGALKSSSLWINVTTSFLLSLMEPSPYIADKKGRRPATTFLILTFDSWNNFIISKKPIQENTIGGGGITSWSPTQLFYIGIFICKYL